MRQGIGYLRVSTVGQAEDGLSLEAQEARIKEWCVREDVLLRNLHEDRGLSGRSDDRPGLRKALEDCRKGDVLVVYSLSRLARSTRDTLNILAVLESRGVDLVSLSERLDGSTAAGRMMVKLLAVLAEFESEQLGERTSLAMRHLRKTGRYTGGKVPFGYNLLVDGTLVGNPQEQSILERVRVLRGSGCSLREIGNLLAGSGQLSRSGQPFQAAQILRMIRQSFASPSPP